MLTFWPRRGGYLKGRRFDPAADRKQPLTSGNLSGGTPVRQVAATWRRPIKRPGETIEITPLVPHTEQIMRSAARKASALA
jgi:hypothetical protein